MKWQGDTAFPRPLRWLLALHGAQPLRFVFAGLAAGAGTRLLRSASADVSSTSLQHAAEYEALLRGALPAAVQLSAVSAVAAMAEGR